MNSSTTYKPPTDQEKIHHASDMLHDWLRKWPHKGSMGSHTNIKVIIDGVLCELTLRPIEVVSNPRLGRIKAWVTRLKKD